MSEIEAHPVPKSVADMLREIPEGETRLFSSADADPQTVRSTLSRLRRNGEDMNFVTRIVKDGLRVWRLL